MIDILVQTFEAGPLDAHRFFRCAVYPVDLLEGRDR
jgi:hypothetical protein